MEFETDAKEAGLTLASVIRRHLPGTSWNDARRLVERGKLFINGERERDPARRLEPGLRIEIRRNAPVPKEEIPGEIIHETADYVVFEKPAGVSSVPVSPRDPHNAMDLIRRHWSQAGRKPTEDPLFVVHRIDKETSGNLVFAKTKNAELELASQFRAHAVGRTYMCIAHGVVNSDRIESRLVPNRGDGLKGSARRPGQGQRAVTLVRPIKQYRLATLCEVRLETGKTHQIRIHLAERGHPLVGEQVYIRDFLAAGGKLLPANRLFLHAATLEFTDPPTGNSVRFESPLPEEFSMFMLRVLSANGNDR